MLRGRWVRWLRGGTFSRPGEEGDKPTPQRVKRKGFPHSPFLHPESRKKGHKRNITPLCPQCEGPLDLWVPVPTATSCQGYILEWCGTDGVQCVQLTGGRDPSAAARWVPAKGWGAMVTCQNLGNEIFRFPSSVEIFLNEQPVCFETLAHGVDGGDDVGVRCYIGCI